MLTLIAQPREFMPGVFWIGPPDPKWSASRVRLFVGYASIEMGA